tara:strand:- start:5377 stop:5667 length:291 start_codon:yes stop_codon:yes gene_type:complete
MAILKQLAWGIAKKVASNPRVQRKAIDVVKSVDQRIDRAAEHAVRNVEEGPAAELLSKAEKKIDRAAEKVGQIADSRDPAKEIGRTIGKIFSDKNN